MPDITIDRRKDYAVVSLGRAPVNAMNLQFWVELQAALDSLEADPKMRAVIFQSSLPKDIFTAGNDLTELYAPGTTFERYLHFWTTQNVFLGRLYTSRLVTVCAIRGACPAGGCAIALASDYRIMSEETGHIGLNEPQIGLIVPKMWCELLAKTVGNRNAEILATNGTCVPPKEALRVGLVDMLVPKDKLLPAAEKVVAEWLKLPSNGRSLTKQAMRADLGGRLSSLDVLKEECEMGWKFLTDAKTVAALKRVLEKLSSAKL